MRSAKSFLLTNPIMGTLPVSIARAIQRSRKLRSLILQRRRRTIANSSLVGIDITLILESALMSPSWPASFNFNQHTKIH